MSIKHGCARRGKKSSLYHRWSVMRNRCNNENADDYEYYGGRGITVCEEWEDYTKFADWAYKNGYSEELQIDRIDNDKGYSPDNCRWVSQAINEQNRRVFKNNKLGITGVCFVPQQGRYHAYIDRFGKRLNLGKFFTLEEAIAARKAADVVFAHINFENIDTEKLLC